MDKDKFEKQLRDLHRTAAKLDKALSKSEQEENNRLLALRIEERKTARPDMAVADVIKNGTPEEKAILHLKNFDMGRMYKEAFLSKEEQKALANSFDTIEEKAVFLNYLKLFADLGQYADKLAYVFKMYQVEVALLSKLIDKYDAIQREIVVYEILYGSLVMSNGHSGMGYNIKDNDKTKMKRLDDTTPEALLAEFNEVHKNDGVIFRANVKGDLQWGTLHENGSVSFKGYINEDGANTIIADIDYKGGLYDQIKEQAEECEEKLSFVKAYIEPIEEYLEGNFYHAFAPSRLELTISNVKEERFSRDIIAPEYHLSHVNGKRANGEEVTKGEEYEAVVPDYNEVQAHEEVKQSCYKFIKQVRNEPYQS